MLFPLVLVFCALSMVPSSPLRRCGSGVIAQPGAEQYFCWRTLKKRRHLVRGYAYGITELSTAAFFAERKRARKQKYRSAPGVPFPSPNSSAKSQKTAAGPASYASLFLLLPAMSFSFLYFLHIHPSPYPVSH